MLEVAGLDVGSVILGNIAGLCFVCIDLGLALPYSEALESVEVVHRLADFKYVGTAVPGVDHGRVLGSELKHLVLVVGYIELGVPLEVLMVDVVGVEFDFEAFVVSVVPITARVGTA